MIINQLKFTIVIYFLIAIANFSFPIYSQTLNIKEYQYISPKPGSSLHLPETNIIIRQGEVIDNSSLESNKITVLGSKSGTHTGGFFLSLDLKTLIFKPFNSFTNGENVTVKLSSGIRTINDNFLLPIEFGFSISLGISEAEVDRVESNISKSYKMNFSQSNIETFPIPNLVTGLPEDFPEIIIDVNHQPSEGFWFIAPFTYPNPSTFIAILDNNGIPIFYERTNYRVYNFKKQPNGLLAFGDIVSHCYYVKDSSYTLIDTFYTGNGYLTDNHDFLLLSNGHSFLMGYDYQPVRMDTIVQGGDSTAIVKGLIIQELDELKNVIFQWRSWDHYKITDATEDIDLTAHTIDYVHGNTIELDYDGNIMISARNMDEITKINRQTGNIIWRWGGTKSRNNQFQFVSDQRTFSHQHDIRRIENGNVTLFDNGNLHNPQYSRAIEYELDEVEKKATLVWDFIHDPPIYKTAMGNVQRLSNNSTIIGWGGWLNTPTEAFSEISDDLSVEFEVSLPDTFTNYRAFKFPWRTNRILTNPDSLFFESIAVGDSALQTVILKNNSVDVLVVTEFYNKFSYYSVESEVPITLNGNESVPIDIKFNPTEEGFFKDVLHIRSDTENRRIAQLVILAGRTDTTFSGVENEIVPQTFSLKQNYPNPFNPRTTIRFSIPEMLFTTLKVYDLLGNEVATLLNEEKSGGSYEIEFDGSNLSSGVYFYRIKAGDLSDIKKFILLK